MVLKHGMVSLEALGDPEYCLDQPRLFKGNHRFPIQKLVGRFVIEYCVENYRIRGQI